MKTLLTIGVLCLTLSLSCRDPMEHAHCEDTEIKRMESPNRKLVAVVYNRDCSGGAAPYTYADIEDPSEHVLWPRDRHPTVCYLVTLPPGVHPLDVRWKDDGHMEVGSSDELDSRYSVSYPEQQCEAIQVAYHFKFAPPPLDEAPDQETVDAISSAIAATQKCFDGGLHPERTERLKSFMQKRQHGDALEWVCTYMLQEHCQVSTDVFATIQRAAMRMRRSKMSCYRLEERVKP